MNSFGPITLTTTGSGANARSFTGFGFDPSELEFEVGAKNNSSAHVNFSIGAVDSSDAQFCNSGYASTTITSRQSYTDRCIQVWEYTGGNWVEVLQANFHSYITDGFKLNVTIANPSYQVFVKART